MGQSTGQPRVVLRRTNRPASAEAFVMRQQRGHLLDRLCMCVFCRSSCGVCGAVMWLVHKQGHKAAAEQLLKCGSNIDATSSRRASSLFMTTYYGHVDVTFLLLAWGEQPASRVTGTAGIRCSTQRMAASCVHADLAPPSPFFLSVRFRWRFSSCCRSWSHA